MTRLIPIGDMPVRDPSMRLPFTQSDTNHMIEWLVENAADGTTRTGNKLWQGLMKNPSTSTWSSRHTWQSWRQRYLDRQAQYDLMINTELKKRVTTAVGSPHPFTQQDAKRLAWYFRIEQIPEESRLDISVFKRLIEENKWEWCARHSDAEWKLLYSVKGEAIDSLAASDEPLDYWIPTPAKFNTTTSASISPSKRPKRPRPPEVTSLDNETEGPIPKKRRLNETSASALVSPNTVTAPVDDDDPKLASPLAPLQTNGDAPIGGQPISGAELVAEAQTTKESDTLEGRDTRLADGEVADVSVVPESIREPTPLSLPGRSPSIQLVSSSKHLKQKWRPKAFTSFQIRADDNYFETPPSSPNTYGTVDDPAPGPLKQNEAQADATSQRAQHEDAEDVESLNLEFEEVVFEESVVEKLEQEVKFIDHSEDVSTRNEPQTVLSPAEETSTTAANGMLFNISDNEYQHAMPQYSDSPDVFSNPLVNNGTRREKGSRLATFSKREKGSHPVKKGLSSGHLERGDSPAIRDTSFFKQASGTRHSVDGYSQSPLPSSSAPHSPISSVPTHTRMGVYTPPHFKVTKRNGEGNRTRVPKVGPTVSGPPKKARAPPPGVPVLVQDPSPIHRRPPPQLRKEPRAERRRTFGGWSTVLATSSLRKEEVKTSNPRGRRRDSTSALPATMFYRDQQEDADWLRSVEKKIKVIPQYTDRRKRSIPSLPPETSSDHTNTANESEDEDDLAEKISRMSSLDIERVMKVLNVAPRDKVLKKWKRQHKSNAWIIWNGLDFVLEELANRFNTGVIAAREAWAAAGDLIVTEKALYHAQEMGRRTVADVIKSEAEEASKRRMEIWGSIEQTPERWRGTSGRNSRLYRRSGGPPEFVPAEAVQVAVEAASSPLHDRGVRRGSSNILRAAFEELPMLSFDGVGPGGVTILRE